MSNDVSWLPTPAISTELSCRDAGDFLKTTTAMAAKLPPMPPVETPPAFADKFPTPQELTEANFAFAQKLLKQQKSFAEKLLAASTVPTSAVAK